MKNPYSSDTVEKGSTFPTYSEFIHGLENCRKSSVISCPLFALWRIWYCTHTSHSGSGSLQVLQHLVASVMMWSLRHGLHDICIRDSELFLWIKNTRKQVYIFRKDNLKKNPVWIVISSGHTVIICHLCLCKSWHFYKNCQS